MNPQGSQPCRHDCCNTEWWEEEWRWSGTRGSVRRRAKFPWSHQLHDNARRASTGVEGTTAYRDDYTANCGACYQDKDGPVGPDGTFPENGGRAYCTVADTIGQICQNVPGCEPDPDHDPFKYRERLGPASPPQTLPQPLPQPLNRRNLRFGYKEDVFCPEGCKPKED